MSEYTYKLVNGRTKTVTIKDGKPELYSELEWALWLDINSMEQRHLDDLKCIEELKDKLARSDRKEIEAVYRRLGELEAKHQWQPIETAPRDGRRLILLYGPSRFPQVAYSNTWWTAGFSAENKPTHWMPLPKPPENQHEL